MASIFTDDFNSYSDGAIVGQGSWTNQQEGDKFTVQGTTVKEGAKALQVVIGGTITPIIHKTGTGVATGRLSFYVRKTGTNHEFIVSIEKRSTTQGAIVKFDASGNITYFNGSTYATIQAYSADTWYLIEVEWRVSDHKARYRIDGGTWTDYYAVNGSTWTELDAVRLFGDASISGTSYIDYIDENPIVTTIIYTLICAQSSFSLTGISALFTKALNLIASVGDFALTGIAVILNRGKTLFTTVGNYTVTGVNISFTKALNLIASVGSYTLTGIDTILSKGLHMVISVGEFALTGIDLLFHRGWVLIASVGEYTLTGIDVILNKGYKLITSVGEFTLTGIDLLIHRGYNFAVNVGSFILTGIDVVFPGKGNWLWTNRTKPTTSWTNRTKP